ncbi:MAG: 2-oxo acid dehydrogenase subunit E2 [Chlamydiia bacterium]|nr:2-oxo acid dehydrogenase subunit E2 [Chlamydiia bacterium]
MTEKIKVPQMGESIAEATIGEVFKPSGSFVKQDDEILELETDKVNQVIFATASGKIELSVASGDTVQVEQEIGSIDTDQKPEEADREEEQEELKETKKPAPEPAKKETKPAESAARESKEAYVKELDNPKIEAQKPTIQRATLEGEKRKKMSRLRQTIADRLVQAKTETAMLTTFNEIDLTQVIELRAKNQEAFQKKYGIKMGFMPFFVLAALSAIKEYPIINSQIDGDEIVEPATVNMGIAVSTEKGLVVPVIPDADKLNFFEIEQAIATLAERGREGSLTIDEIRGGTFTITNGGLFGSLLSTPILNFPQSAILGMHTIQKRPVVIDDEIKIRSMMYVALSYDHRLIDGKDAVLFLKHIKSLLEEPGRFILGA